MAQTGLEKLCHCRKELERGIRAEKRLQARKDYTGDRLAPREQEREGREGAELR